MLNHRSERGLFPRPQMKRAQNLIMEHLENGRSPNLSSSATCNPVDIEGDPLLCLLQLTAAAKQRHFGLLCRPRLSPARASSIDILFLFVLRLYLPALPFSLSLSPTFYPSAPLQTLKNGYSTLRVDMQKAGDANLKSKNKQEALLCHLLLQMSDFAMARLELMKLYPHWKMLTCAVL